MDLDLESLAQQYALKRNIKLGERLGFGIYGIVFAAQDNRKPAFFAVRWPEVSRVLAALQSFGVYLLDINPGNISFPGETQ